MGDVAANTSSFAPPQPSVPYRTFGALVSAGFRRWSTYRQATLASLSANVVFGFLRSAVLLAVAASTAGQVAGYDRGQLLSYVWLGQAIIGTVAIWDGTELSERIRSGEIAADLLRPVHPVLSYLATDVGRAGYAVLVRFAGPVLVGALFFDLHVPQRAATWPLAVLSLVLAVLVSFGCRYLVGTCAYWLLDARGPWMLWVVASGVLGGLYFPLHFLPGRVVTALWLATPFPSLLQAPCDVVVERGSTGVAVGLVAIQAAWAVVLLGGCVLVQRLAERHLVIHGG